MPLGGSIAVGNEFPKANDLPVTLPVKSEHNVKIGCSNGGLESDTNPDTLNHNDQPPDGGLSVCTVSAQNMLGCGAAPPHNIGVEGRTNENVNASDSPSFALVLKKVFRSLLTVTVYIETKVLSTTIFCLAYSKADIHFLPVDRERES